MDWMLPNFKEDGNNHKYKNYYFIIVRTSGSTARINQNRIKIKAMPGIGHKVDITVKYKITWAMFVYTPSLLLNKFYPPSAGDTA